MLLRLYEGLGASSRGCGVPIIGPLWCSSGSGWVSFRGAPFIDIGISYGYQKAYFRFLGFILGPEVTWFWAEHENPSLETGARIGG